jgi:hypothetical protein
MAQVTRLTMVLAGLAACAGSDPPPERAGGALTYRGDVQPILAARCWQCHLDGPSSYQPFFDSYEHVAQVAGSIAIAAGKREMPPWAVTADGSCGDWDRAHWLPDDEIRVLEEWPASDMLEGEPDQAELRGPEPAPLSLRRVDAVVDTGADYQPRLGESLHRCFRAELSLERAAYLTAFEVLPGNPRAVQHVSMYALDSDAAEQRVAALEQDDGAPGYHCFGGSRAPDSHLLGTWTWGESAFRYPDGTGIRIEAGRSVVLQIHYNASGGSATPDPDRTRVQLELADSAREGRFVPLEVPELSLAPGQELATATALLDAPETMDVHGVFPFMHSLGHSMMLLDGGGGCLAQVRHWHLYGHMRYHGYREPVRVSAGDRLWLECTYDTRSRTEATGAGEAFGAEACRLQLYATSPE